MERQRAQTLGLIAGAALALLILATALHDVTLLPGRPLNLSFLLPTETGAGARSRIGLPGWLAWVAAAGLVAAAIGLIVSPQFRRDLLRNLPAYLLLLFGVYLLSQSASNGGVAARPPAGPAYPAPELPAQPELPTPGFISNPPEWLVTAFTVLLTAGLFAAAALVLRRLRKRPSPIAQIVEEAREALAELRAGAELRDTISRCYAEMVRVLSSQRGIGRDVSLTPREFEQRLAAAGLADRHIRRLTRLFERVRYSPHAPGAAEEREAQECLQSIISAYESGA